MALNRFRAAGVCISVHSDTITIFCWVSAFGQGIGVLMLALWSAKQAPENDGSAHHCEPFFGRYCSHVFGAHREKGTGEGTIQ